MWYQYHILRQYFLISSHCLKYKEFGIDMVTTVVSTTSNPWSERAAVPDAIIRAMCRAAIVSAVAPHTPRVRLFPDGLILRAPISRCRQQIPKLSSLHWGFCASDRSHTLSIFSSSIYSTTSGMICQQRTYPFSISVLLTIWNK